MCKYCCNTISQKDLLNKESTNVCINVDDKKIVFEHTEIINITGNPWDGEEDILSREVDIEFCPKCGRKL